MWGKSYNIPKGRSKLEKEEKKQTKKGKIEQPCKIVIDKEPNIDYKICPLCGHSNKSTEGFCKMCSNYLY